MKQGFFRSDWFAALAFALVFAIVAYGVFGNAFQGLERSTYDLGVRERNRIPSDRVAVIAIDDQSIQNLGRWPWPRTLHAQLVDKLRAGGAKVIGSTVFYSESEQDAGAAVIEDLAKSLQASPLTQQIPAEIDSFNVMLQDTAQHDRAVAGIAKAYRQSSLATEYGKSIEALSAKLDEARKRLASDNSLAQAFSSAGNVLLPMSFELGRPQGRPDKPLPDYIRRFALTRRGRSRRRQGPRRAADPDHQRADSGRRTGRCRRRHRRAQLDARSRRRHPPGAAGPAVLRRVLSLPVADGGCAGLEPGSPPTSRCAWAKAWRWAA